MGISAQNILASDPEYLQRQLQQQEMQRLNPTGGAAGALGALLGRGLGNVTSGRGFFDAADTGLRRVSDVQRIMSSTQFDPENPASYYETVAKSLQSAGYGDLAPLAFQEANKLKIQQEELGIKRTTAGREARKEERDTLKFYKDNPEQTGPALQQLALQLEQDPNNKTLLDRYNKIAQAGTSGAMEETAKAEKEALSAESIRTTIQKNKKELAELDFNAGMRWNAEREAALALFNANGLDPTQPLKGSALMNTELVNAQKIALREPFSGTAPTVTPKPTAAPAANASIKSAVEAAGQKYEPNKYDYRIGPTGQVERKLK